MTIIVVTEHEFARAVGRARRRQQIAIAGSVPLLTGVGALLTWTPPYLGFGFAVAAAMGWCVWLEKHPETPNAESAHSDVVAMRTCAPWFVRDRIRCEPSSTPTTNKKAEPRSSR